MVINKILTKIKIYDVNEFAHKVYENYEYFNKLCRQLADALGYMVDANIRYSDSSIEFIQDDAGGHLIISINVKYISGNKYLENSTYYKDTECYVERIGDTFKIIFPFVRMNVVPENIPHSQIRNFDFFVNYFVESFLYCYLGYSSFTFDIYDALESRYADIEQRRREIISYKNRFMEE